MKYNVLLLYIRMINRFTKVKMNDTFLSSKDGKGYIFDIRRPAMKKNRDIYTQEKEAVIILPGRTGLGNRVLRRVNFIKPEIQARKVVEGRMRPPIKSLQEMIKEGIKIKYEEPDPWDTEWITKHTEITRSLKAEGKTEAYIDDYLKKYPPLNRTQRSRPVNKDPFEDANKPIADQLKVIGQNVVDVSTAVTKNSTDALQNSVNQMTDNNRLALWTGGEIAKVEAIINQLNLDSDAGRNMLGAKLQEIVNQMTIQQALSNKILMSSIQQLNLPIDTITELNLSEIQKNNLSVIALMAKYKLKDTDSFIYIDKNDVQRKLPFIEILYRMSNVSNIILVNDKANNNILFKYDKITQPPRPEFTIQETTDLQTALKTLGYNEPLEENNSTSPSSSLPALTLLDEVPDESPEDKKYNQNQIVDIIRNGIKIITQRFDTEVYIAWESNYKSQGKIIPDGDKRILRINLDYRYKYDTSTNKFIQYNMDFLKIDLVTGNARTAFIKNYPTLDVFEDVYESKTNPDEVYFVWYKNFFSIYNAVGEGMRDLRKYIRNEIDTIFITGLEKNYESSKTAKDLQVLQDAADLANAQQLAIQMKQDAQAEADRIAAENIAIAEATQKAQDAKAAQDAKNLTLSGPIISKIMRKKQKKTKAELIEEAKTDVQMIADAKIAKSTKALKDSLPKKYNELKEKYNKLILSISNPVMENVLSQSIKKRLFDLNEKMTLEITNNSLTEYEYNNNNDEYNLLNTEITKLYTPEEKKEAEDLIELKKLYILQYEYIINKLDDMMIKSTNITKTSKYKHMVQVINSLISSGTLDKFNVDKNINLIKTYIKDENEIKLFMDKMPTLDVTIKTAGSGYKKKNNTTLLYKMKKTKGAGLSLPGSGAKVNPWLVHVKAFRAKNPNMKYSEVLKKAKDTYKK